jgi:hypothetical protein
VNQSTLAVVVVVVVVAAAVVIAMIEGGAMFVAPFPKKFQLHRRLSVATTLC